MIPQLSNPTGERKLHYKVIRHIRSKYPSVVIIPGLGENQSTSFKKRDSKLEGYTSGQPDVMLMAKYGTYTDVVSLELKRPFYEIDLHPNQKIFHEELEKVNVFTLVSNNYDEIIIFLYEHYKTLAEKPKTQQQPQAIALPESFDFSTNNAKFCLNKLQSKQKILDQYSYKNINTDTLSWGLTNIQLIESLIKLDREKSSFE